MYEVKQQNLQLLDVLACNSAGIITELSTKISRSAVFASCIARILKVVFIYQSRSLNFKQYSSYFWQVFWNFKAVFDESQGNHLLDLF